MQERLKVSQNNCVRFCLQLDKKTWIGVALLDWIEFKYVFIGFASMNLRFEVSIQGGDFGVPINYHTLY